MRHIIAACVLLSIAAPARALTPQTVLPRPIACGSAVARVATIDRSGAQCPQWLSTGGVIEKRSTLRG